MGSEAEGGDVELLAGVHDGFPEPLAEFASGEEPVGGQRAEVVANDDGVGVFDLGLCARRVGKGGVGDVEVGELTQDLDATRSGEEERRVDGCDVGHVEAWRI